MKTWDRYRISQVIPSPVQLYVYSGNDDGTMSMNLVACNALVEVNGGTEITIFVHAWGRIVPICDITNVIAITDTAIMPDWVSKTWEEKLRLVAIKAQKAVARKDKLAAKKLAQKNEQANKTAE